jgi:hypothetical protein
MVYALVIESVELASNGEAGLRSQRARPAITHPLSLAVGEVSHGTR